MIPSTGCKFPERLDGVLNFRDVGKSINEVAGEQIMQVDQLFRSARPDEASSSARETLGKFHNVIDLRSASELDEQVKKNRPHGPKYPYIELSGKKYKNELLAKADWWTWTKVVFYHCTKRESKAVAIMGKKVMNKEGPIYIYTLPLSTSAPEIGKVFHLLSKTPSSSSPFPLLIHCAHGKDRTGLIIALILLSLGIDQEWINQDYMKSDKELADDREEREVEIEKSMGLEKKFAGCHEEFVAKVVENLEAKGGVDAWLVNEAEVLRKEIDDIKVSLLLNKERQERMCSDEKGKENKK